MHCQRSVIQCKSSKLNCGVPQGSILGPLFFVIYINDLPNCLNISCAKMFGDDTNITVPGCTFAELEQATNSELTNLYSWLKANKLSLNIAKTEFMVVSSRQKFLAENCSEINIQLDNQPISRVEHAKSLGLIIDDRLSWSNHIKELCRKISSPIGALGRIRRRRQCGPVVRALALRSADPGFKTRSDHSLNLILVVPGSTSQLHL